MKAPSANRRAISRANVQGHAYGANTPHGPALDGVLITWGDRLFYPGNRIVQVRPQPRLDAQGSQGSQHRAAAIRQCIEAAVMRRAPQVIVKVTEGGRSMTAIAAHFRYISKNGRLEIEDQRGEALRGKELLVAFSGPDGGGLDALEFLEGLGNSTCWNTGPLPTCGAMACCAFSKQLQLQVPEVIR